MWHCVFSILSSSHKIQKKGNEQSKQIPMNTVCCEVCVARTVCMCVCVCILCFAASRAILTLTSSQNTLHSILQLTEQQNAYYFGRFFMHEHEAFFSFVQLQLMPKARDLAFNWLCIIIYSHAAGRCDLQKFWPETEPLSKVFFAVSPWVCIDIHASSFLSFFLFHHSLCDLFRMFEMLHFPNIRLIYIELHRRFFSRWQENKFVAFIENMNCWINNVNYFTTI